MNRLAEPQAQADGEARMQALLASDAALRDPVGFRYLQSLHTTLCLSAEPLRSLLQTRLAHAVCAFEARNQPSQAHSAEPEVRPSARKPGAKTSPGPLGELARQLQGRSRSMDPGETNPSPKADPRLEPAPVQDASALHYFRTTWTRLRTGKKLAQALQQAPKNAGPINSHNLVLRSLALMQDLSPDYLNRFVVHVDALLSLDALAATPPKTAKTSKPAGSGSPAKKAIPAKSASPAKGAKATKRGNVSGQSKD